MLLHHVAVMLRYICLSLTQFSVELWQEARLGKLPLILTDYISNYLPAPVCENKFIFVFVQQSIVLSKNLKSRIAEKG